MKIHLIACALCLLSSRLSAQSRCAATLVPGSNGMVYHAGHMEALPGFEQASAYFYGETHNADFEPAWKFHFIRHLHERYEVRDVFMEIGHAAAFLYNQYLLTGDTSLIKGLVYTEFYYREFWQDLYTYNLGLPEQERLIIHGIDFERPEAIRVLTMLRGQAVVPAVLEPVFTQMEQGELLPDFSRAFRELWAQIRMTFMEHDDAVKALYKGNYDIVQRIIRNDCPVTARAIPRNAAMFASLSAALKVNGIRRFAGFFGQAHTTYSSRSSLPNQLRKMPGFTGKVLTFGTVYKDAYAQGGRNKLISYTGMFRKSLLRVLYHRFMVEGCRAVVVPAADIGHKRMSATADHILFGRDVMVR
ncbi:erythromycin esterase family protein [Chitinophaga sp. XS-30]|uniref:erythromycin esterase family protein n=1 Tax=Chitinophaga sp. XS-30 TaxID=2604421 RepID=UPI0011DE37CB|nr:erythromycin esterase family protein [Chitinophaga sp. XS-30]QEH43058.1 erythromycin esterase family protein [Chitinophaga sp. XS-30]